MTYGMCRHDPTFIYIEISARLTAIFRYQGHVYTRTGTCTCMAVFDFDKLLIVSLRRQSLARSLAKGVYMYMLGIS